MILFLKADVCNSILLAFQDNFCSVMMWWVIGLYGPSYNLVLGNVDWVHLYRIVLGNYLPSKSFFLT